MNLDSDATLDSVLQQARAAVEPEPEQLNRVLAGVQRRLLAAPLGADTELVSGPLSRPVPPGALPPAAYPPVAAGAWPLFLRRWLSLSLAAGVGFVLGAKYQERDAARTEAKALASDSAGRAVPPAAAPLSAAPFPVAPLQPVSERAAKSPDARSLERTLARPRGPAAALPAAASSRRQKPSARAGDALSFAEVLERVERAQRAERDLQPELALRDLDELDAHADAATLREERLVTRVLASCGVGDLPAAEAAAARLGDSAQASVYLKRLDESCLATRPAPETPRSTPVRPR